MEVNTALKVEEEFEAQSLTLYEQALSLKVCDKPTYTAAAEFVKPLKDLEKKILDHYAPMKKAAHEAHKAITTKETEDLKPVREAMDLVRKSMNSYLAEVEAARRKAEAEARRVEEEKARKERERLLAQAEKAEAKGNEEKVEELLERAENVYAAPVTVVADMSAKGADVSVSAVMETVITVTDIKVFLAEIVRRGMAPTMVEIKIAPLKAWQKANAIEAFPGLHIQKVPSARIR